MYAAMFLALRRNCVTPSAAAWLNYVSSAAACGARRPLRDLKDTLLHEMIHAVISNKACIQPC
jgi:hypothetical protein